MHGHHHNETNIRPNELSALLEYNFNHNASHIFELSEIAEKLNEQGEIAACETLKSAIAKFSEGNGLLKETLEKLK